MLSTFDTRFSQKPTHRRFLLKCSRKGCKTTHAFDCPLEEVTRYTRGICGVPGSAQPYKARVPMRNLLPDLYCAAHKRPLSAWEVNGTVTDCKCDGRCTSARGANCECSCGGANHGADYL